LEAAGSAYQKALQVANERDDLTEISDVEEHVGAIVADLPELQRSMLWSRQQVRVSQGAALSPGLGKVGRNAPYACGSGRKYKRCCSPRA